MFSEVGACRWHTFPMASRASNSATNVKMAFAKRLRMLREAYGREIGKPGLSQREFAEMLGLETERYSTYERGTREPSISILAEIRSLTGVNLNGLIAGDIDKAA